MEPSYKRIVIKLSGEALGIGGSLFDFDMIGSVAGVIAGIAKRGVQVALVIGGGNIWRGRETQKASANMDRTLADHMGMLGTVINSLAMQDALHQKGQKAHVLSAIPISGMVEPYYYREAIRYLEENHVVLFACGTGDPFHSTDTAAAQRAAEIHADALLMAKNVDGIYDDDPKTNKNAKLLSKTTYQELLRLQQTLSKEAVDTEALLICQKTKLPAMLVFALKNPEDIERIVCGATPGTTVTP